MNNYEKIKQMTVEEMKTLLMDPPRIHCSDCPLNIEECLDTSCEEMDEIYIKQWLLQEVEE